MIVRFAAVVAGCLLVSAVLAGQAPQNPPPSQAQAPLLKPGAAIVLGRVVEAGTTTGIAGATVLLASPALGSLAATFADGTPGGQRRAATDAQGQFVFRDLPAGSYNFLAYADGYVDGTYGQQTAKVSRLLNITRVLELSDADRPMNITLSMWKMGGISGRVLDEAGEPVVAVPVTVFTLTTESGESVMEPVVTTFITDDRGVYHADVTPGDYVIGVVVPTTTIPTALIDGFNQAMREGGDTQSRFMSDVTRNGSILPRGYGARVGGLMVSQMPQNVPVVPPFAGDDGRTWFYPTTFHPAATTGTSASTVTVASGEEKAGIDIRLRPAPARRVSGRAVGPDGPIPGLGIRLHTADQKMWRGASTRVPGSAQAVADPNGQFTFVGISPGAYTLYAERLPGSPTELTTLWAAVPIVVGDADVSNLTVTLQPGGRVKGRVVFETRGEPPALTFRRNLQIVFRPVPVPGNVGTFAYMPLSTNLDDANGFVMREAVPGQYSLATSNASGWIVKSVSANGRDVTDRALDVSSSGIELVVTLTDQVSTLSGTVRDENGQPALKSIVVLFPADRSIWPLASLSATRLQAAAPDRNGSYAFRGLPAGEYFVTAVEWPGTDFSDPTVLTKLATTATRLTVNEGETKAQDLRSVVVR